MAEQDSPKTNAPVSSKQKKLPTPEEFITRWPLYANASIEGFSPPSRVSFHCGGCSKETTWQLMAERQLMNTRNLGGAYWVWYLCGLCSSNYLITVYREAEHVKRPARRASSTIAVKMGNRSESVTIVTKVQKIGQYPAQSMDVPKNLQKNLGRREWVYTKRD